MKKKRRPRYYVLWMLAQPLVFGLFFVLGALLDSAIFTRQAEVLQELPGHPAPVFSLLLPMLGAVVCAVVFLIALVGLIRCLRRRRREKQAAGTRE